VSEIKHVYEVRPRPKKCGLSSAVVVLEPLFSISRVHGTSVERIIYGVESGKLVIRPWNSRIFLLAMFST